MKKIITVLALVAMASTAQAADWETGKGDRWTGAYIGAYGVGGVVDPDGYTIGGGAQIGADYQFGNWVVGAVADGSISYVEVELWGYVYDGSMVQASARGRAGYAFDNLLIYGTGGVGYTLAEIEGYRAIDDTSWVAGGGVEWMLSDNISLTGEVLYWDSLQGTQGKLGFNVRF